MLRTWEKSSYRPKSTYSRDSRTRNIQPNKGFVKSLSKADSIYNPQERKQRGGGNKVERVGAGVDNRMTFKEQRNSVKVATQAMLPSKFSTTKIYKPSANYDSGWVNPAARRIPTKKTFEST